MSLAMCWKGLQLAPRMLDHHRARNFVTLSLRRTGLEEPEEVVSVAPEEGRTVGVVVLQLAAAQSSAAATGGGGRGGCGRTCGAAMAVGGGERRRRQPARLLSGAAHDGDELLERRVDARATVRVIHRPLAGVEQRRREAHQRHDEVAKAHQCVRRCGRVVAADGF